MRKFNEKNKNVNYLILSTLLVAILIIGASFAFFSYYRASEEESEIVAGSLYLNFVDDSDSISLTNAFPEEDATARSKTNNYITFTVKGKNTSTKDIYYEILLNKDADVSGKTRFDDNHLKFDLIETVNGVSTRVLSGVTYDEINNTRIWVNTVSKNTTSEVSISYQLRMWLSSDILISDTLQSADYSSSEFANSYANIKVSVNGDFEEKTVN